MDVVFEISKLLQYSPKRTTAFKDIKAEVSPDSVGFRVLRPTRWTVRNETFRSVIDNYSALIELWNMFSAPMLILKLEHVFMVLLVK